MATKRIETLTVNFTSNLQTLRFEDVLSALSSSHAVLSKPDDRQIELRLIAPNNDVSRDYIVGVVITTKLSGLPPKHDTHTGTTEPLGFGPNQGLGFANVFLFEKRRNILMYEFNKNGTYISQFMEFVQQKADDIYQPLMLHDTNFRMHLECDPILKSGAYQRMLDIGVYRQLEIAIANPTEFMQYVDQSSENGRSIQEILGVSTYLDSPKFRAIYYSERSPSSHLNTSAFRRIMNVINYALGTTMGGNVETIKLKGYYIDPDGRSVLQQIDLLTDRYLKQINLPEPRELSDFQEGERRELIVSLYLSCLDELSRIL